MEQASKWWKYGAVYGFLPGFWHNGGTTTATTTTSRCTSSSSSTRQRRSFSGTGYTTLFVETKGLTASLPLARLHPRGAFDHPSVAHQRVHLSFLIAIAPRQIMIALISFPSRLPRPWLRYAPFQQPMRAKGADTRGDKPPPSFFTSNSSHRLCVNNRVSR